MSCPDTQDLTRFLAEEVPAASQDSIVDHVEGCASCQEKLDTLSGLSRVVDQARTVFRSQGLADAAPGDDGAQLTIGAYRTERILGRGGMGVVYLARQERPQREVALKVMHSHLVSELSLRRFELEVEVLGRLDHPGIAKIFEAGTASIGGEVRPFFAMDYVDGTRLDRWVAGRDLDLSERLALLLEVCDAVHHAHVKGVVHRDLKPGNILVDGLGHPRVIDFGLARATDPGALAASVHTEAGRIVGTLPYMAPEQIEGDPASVDTRTDIYALGAVAYELLCGRPPIDVSASLPGQALRRILEEEPPSPSAIDRRLPREVDWILQRALAKDRERRYASVVELAQDLRHFLADEPLVAGPPSTAYRVSLFARRHRAAVAAGLAVFAALTFGWVRAEAARDDAERAAIEASRNAEEARIARDEATRNERAADTARQRAERNEAEALRAHGAAQRATERALAARDDFKRALGFVRAAFGLGSTLVATNQPPSLHEIAAAAVPEIESRFAGAPEVQAELLNTFGMMYELLGAYASGEELVGSALRIRRELLGDEHLDTLQSFSDLGRIHLRRGDLAAAEPLLVHAVRARTACLGPDHVDTLESTGLLGWLRLETGDVAESEALFRTCLEGLRRLWGEHHVETIIGMQNLGTVVARVDRLEEAEPLLSDALRRSLALLGDDDIQSHELMLNLSTLMAARARERDAESDAPGALRLYERAEELSRLSLDGHRRVLGDEHPLTAEAQRSLDMILGERMESALDHATATLGEDHDETVAVRDALLAFYYGREQLEQALPLLGRALAASGRRHGEDHPETWGYRAHLARHLAASERFGEAEAVLVDVLTKVRDAPTSDEALANRLERQLAELRRARGAAGR